jgi:hypothetical protein
MIVWCRKWDANRLKKTENFLLKFPQDPGMPPAVPPRDVGFFRALSNKFVSSLGCLQQDEIDSRAQR